MRSLAVVAAASVFVLSGCLSAPPPVPPGPDAEEVEELQDKLDQQFWESVRLADSPLTRPDIPVVRRVQPAEWQSVFSDCLSDAGIEGVSMNGGVLTFDGSQSGGELFGIAFYTCQKQYPTRVEEEYERTFYSEAQLGYLYDHWTVKTAPCFRLLGIPVAKPPARDDFIEGFYFGLQWTPYEHLYEQELGFRLDQEEPAWELAEFRCPPLPEEPFGALGIR